MNNRPIVRFPIRIFFIFPFVLLLFMTACVLLPGFISVMSAAFRTVLLLLVLLACIGGGWLYYQLFHRVTRQMDGIRDRYSLSVPDSVSRRFIPYLQFVLDMVDHTLDVEYSNQLMRKQAEFDSMKSQINPHFLYNTLDSIRGYALMEKAPIAADMIEILSRIFRYSISQKNEIIRIREELKMVEDYIAIQDYRLSNHIELTMNTEEPSLLDYPVPKLIIQPFVENAIKHGMSGKKADLHLTIQVGCTDQRLVISVKDDGSGMTADKVTELNEKLYENEYGKEGIRVRSEKGSGIAVVNVNARLKLLYGEDYGVLVYSTPGVGSEFQIAVPYREDLPDEQRTIADRASEQPPAYPAGAAVSFR